MTDLPALLARVEAATGPDRELDRDILLAVGGAIDGQYWRWPGEDRSSSFGSLPPFTFSLDATVALVRKKRPGAIWRVGEDGAIALAVLFVPSYVVHKGVTAATPPLALLAALLRSMIEEEGK